MSPQNKTLIIAGCTRSGLTLMMQILHRGGYPCFGDYPAFENYEVGKIDYAANAGKAIKVVDTNNQFPQTGQYYVIRLRRDLKQQAKSIIKFMRAMGLPVNGLEIKTLQDSLKKSYKEIDSWAARQKGLLYVDFETLIKNPKKVLLDLENRFDIILPVNSITCVKSRETNCYPGMLELDFLHNLKA